MKLKIALLVAGVTVLVVQAAQPAVLAQSTSSESTQINSNSNSLRISPVRTDLALDPGQTKAVTVYIQNMSARTISSRAIVSDFVASLDESGKPEVILKEDEYAKSHSLKRLASTEPNTVTLKPGERLPVNVKITVPKNALAGGYYGAARFVPTTDLTTGDDTGVAISTNVGSLILLKVNGDIEEKASLASFDVRQKDKAGGFFNTPESLTAVVRFKGEGNVQVAPYGKVRIVKSGKTVEEHEINNTDPRGNVLPDSVRRFEVKLNKIGSFGKYTAEANLGYGTSGELITAKTSFWVVPVSYIIGIGVVLMLIILLAILIPKMLGAYKRRILSGRGRRY